MTQNQEPTADGSVDEASVREAMAVYSADGQADDETGSDAAAEQLRAQTDETERSDEGVPNGPA